MGAGLTELEWEALSETSEGFGQESEWEFEADLSGGGALRAAALAAARSALAASGVGPGAAAASFGAEGEDEYEGEFESFAEHEINPARKVYLDAMMEHIAHEAAEAESEDEAAEGFLPLIPMLAGKLLPLAAKVLPKVAGKVMPRIAKAVARATPRLSRGVSNIARTLFRNRRTRPLVRTIPNIAKRAVTTIARHAAAGRPVTPATAQRVLAQQAYRVLARPRLTARVMRHNAVMDRRYHGATQTPVSGPRPGVRRQFVGGHCPACGSRMTGPRSGQWTCRCSWNS